MKQVAYNQRCESAEALMPAESFARTPLAICLALALSSLSLQAMAQANSTLPTVNLRHTATDQTGLNNANSSAAQPSGLDSRLWAQSAGAVKTVKIESDKDGLPANGENEITLTITLSGENGASLIVETPVLVETTRGRLLASGKNLTALEVAIDRDKTTPGIQAVAQNGKLTITLVAPTEPGDAIVRVTAGAVSQKIALTFTPDLRPMIAAGIVEGVINFGKRSGNVLQPVRRGDGFEQEIGNLQRSWDSGTNRFGARTAFFLKGKIKGDALLTASYDSEKDTKERAFKDINPETFYPVYGDASQRSFEANGSGRFFVRIDKNKSYALYGDFNTNEGSTNDVVLLGKYSRSLTGLKGHWENSAGQLTAFASKDSLRQVVDELAGRGISGPYSARYANGIQNTEAVEILVRDRNAPSQILSVLPQVRFVDYDFEPFSGSILFKSPIPSLDANLNPISIRVSYEVEEGGSTYWVAGAEGAINIASNLTVGASVAHDSNPLAKYDLASINARWKLAAQTSVTVEAAQSRRGVVTDFGSLTQNAGSFNAPGVTSTGGSGDAYRLELRHQGDTLEARAYLSRVDADFYNSSASVVAGRKEAGIKGTYKISETLRANAEIIRNEDIVTGGERSAGSVGLAWDVNPAFTLEAGARIAKQSGAGASAAATAFPTAGIDPNNGGLTLSPFAGAANNPYSTSSLRLKGTWRPNEKWSVFAEGEQGVADSKGHALAVGGDYRVNEVVRMYGRSEWSSGLAGSYGLVDNNGRQAATVIGADAQYMQGGQLFSEYRLRDALGGREAQAAVGLRNVWTIAEGLRINTNFERVKTLAGPDNQAVAAAVGLDYTANELWKGAGRIEARNDNKSTSFLNTLAGARKLSESWTLLARNYYLRKDVKGTDLGDSVNDRFQIGAAWRESATNRWNALAKYEYRLEDVVGSAQSNVHLVSAHADYHPSRSWWLSGQLAGKWRKDSLACTGVGQGCVNSSFNAQLLQGRAMVDLTNKWDAGLIVSVLGESGFKNRRWGWSAETGYMVAGNTWLSVGYNFRGIADKDLLSDYSGKGVFIKLRWKFDEKIFATTKSDVLSAADSGLKNKP